MFISIENTQYHIKITGKGTPIFALHGFSQSLNAWDSIENYFKNLQNCHDFCFISIDLIGHGKSDKPQHIEAYSLETIIKHLHMLIHKILAILALKATQKYILLAYSLGGRIALHYTLQYQEEMHALVLESASYGIKNIKEREKRKISDFTLADKIIQDDLEQGSEQAMRNFHKYWSNLSIFATQKNLPELALKKIETNRLKNLPHALANTLKATSQGILPCLVNKLSNLSLPTLFISGELDKKYTQLGMNFVKKNKKIQHKIIKNTGHNTHLENADTFINTLSNFLQSLTKIS